MSHWYVIDEQAQHHYVRDRDAATFLPFLLPHLRPGMAVLDAGCGVGSIALDIARRIAPGRLTGIDVDPGQIEVARRSAADRGIDNVVFETGSVTALPFPDGSFDAVYANAVLQYLPDPVHALSELRRVLRPGGLAAVSDDDLATVVASPDLPELRLAVSLFERAVAHQGGNTRYSRHLRSLMRAAGFARTQGFALAPEVYGDTESVHWFVEFATGLFGAPRMSELIVAEGWATRAELARLHDALRSWAGQPDAFMSWLYCAAIGWAP
ncbi:MAG TPA: methyltransferase domain-containing protein [Natronosporangium sp.]